MKKPLFFFDELYRMNFYFHPGYSTIEFSESIKNNMDVKYVIDANASGHCVAVEGEEGAFGIFIWIRSTEISDQSIATLVHETIHACNLTFDRVGIKLDALNDEAQAYYATWIFNRCMTGWRQHQEEM